MDGYKRRYKFSPGGALFCKKYGFFFFLGLTNTPPFFFFPPSFDVAVL